MSPYKSRVEIWAELCEQQRPGFAKERGIALPPDPDNASIRWGLAFENEIIALASAEAGETIADLETLVTMKTESAAILTAHLDGIFQATRRIHEGKTTVIWTFNERWGDPGSNQLPREYQVQVQHQMLVAGLTRAVVSVLCWPVRPEQWEESGITADKVPADSWAETLYLMGFFHQFEVEADPDLQALMIESYDEFWNRHVLPEIAPPPKSKGDLAILFPEPKGTAIADEKIERAAAEYAQINKEIGIMKKRKDELAAAIVGWCKPRSALAIDKDSKRKLIVRDKTGIKLGQYDGNSFRIGKNA